MVETRVGLRPAQSVDAVGIARVQVETWRDAYVGILPDGVLLNLDETRAAVRWGRLIDRLDLDECLIVAESDGLIIGFCQCGPAREGLDDVLGGQALGVRERRGGGVAEIYALYVDPNYQGLGIGRALLGMVTRRLVAQGYEAVGAITLSGNRNARRFYEDLGAVPGDEVPSVVAGAPAEQIAYLWVEIERLVTALETVEG